MPLNVTISEQELRGLLESGFLLRERMEFDKALEVFEGAVALRPDVEVAQLGLANMYEVTGRHKDAQAVLETLVKKNPKSAVAQLQLGEFFHTHGKKDEAKKALDQAMALDPNGPTGDAARATLAVIDQGIDYSYDMSKK